MKIRLLSDLHLEGYPYYYEYAGEDVVVLAGDIHTQGRHKFILDQIPTAVQILFVPGNHEYYGAVFETANEYFKELENKYSNFKFLNNESITIRDVDFFGGTMFTDWELDNDTWTAKQRAKNGVADFNWISKIGRDGIERMWNPEDHLQQHLVFRDNLVQWLVPGAAFKRVVISHFVPHPNGSDPKYAGSALNPYFLCDMREHMKDVNIWLYGHTHCSRDFMEGDTRLVCNPRGYGDENKDGWIKHLILEI
jgi:predicted phosphodiesterase